MSISTFIKENLTLKNITLPLFYVFNAVSVSSDIFLSLAWFGVTTKIAFILSSLVILGWVLLYLSSHNEKKRENLDENKIELEPIKQFIINQLDVQYLYASRPGKQVNEIHEDHFKFLFALTVFHYFKKSFADSVHVAILNNEKFENIEEKFNSRREALKKIDISEIIDQTYFNYEDISDKYKHKQGIEQEIQKFINQLKGQLKLKNKNHINSYQGLIDELDAFSIAKRNKITDAISSDQKAEDFFKNRGETLKHLSYEDKKTTLKLMLKIEHTYTLKNQRNSLTFIWLFSIINSLSNGVIMLASGFAKVGFSAIKLLLFTLSGICCSYILTSPKIYNIVKSIIGYFENYCRSDNKAAQTQKTSFIFKTSLLMSFITALASGLFAFYVLHNCLITLNSHTLITAALYSSYFMSFITFCGAFCLYFDSIFAILSNNKKDIFSPEDSLSSILGTSISKQDILMLAALTILSALICIVAINSSYLCLGMLMVLLAVPAMFLPITKKQITSFASVLIALSITATATHQICTILALPINMATIAILATFSFVQSTTLACTFYKGLNKITNQAKKTWKRIKREQTQPIQADTPSSAEELLLSQTNGKKTTAVDSTPPRNIRADKKRSDSEILLKVTITPNRKRNPKPAPITEITYEQFLLAAAQIERGHDYTSPMKLSTH